MMKLNYYGDAIFIYSGEYEIEDLICFVSKELNLKVDYILFEMEKFIEYRLGLVTYLHALIEVAEEEGLKFEEGITRKFFEDFLTKPISIDRIKTKEIFKNILKKWSKKDWGNPFYNKVLQ